MGSATCELSNAQEFIFASVAIEEARSDSIFGGTVEPQIGNSVGVVRSAIASTKGDIALSAGVVRIRAVDVMVFSDPIRSRNTFESAIVGRITFVVHSIRRLVCGIRSGSLLGSGVRIIDASQDDE